MIWEFQYTIDSLLRYNSSRYVKYIPIVRIPSLLQNVLYCHGDKEDPLFILPSTCVLLIFKLLLLIFISIYVLKFLFSFIR